MFGTNRRINVILSLLFIITMGACGGTGGGCGGCAMQPLPAGGLPRDQTVEGGGQIRVTPAGFTKLRAIVPGLITSGLAGGFCIPAGSAVGIDYCAGNHGGCVNGCRANVAVTSTAFSIVDTHIMNITVDTRLTTSVNVNPFFPFDNCTLNLDAPIHADVDVRLGIAPTTGELTLEVADINNISLGNINHSGCSAIGFILDVADAILDIGFINNVIFDLLQDTVDNIIQGFLPDPLGIAGTMDVGAMMASLSPSTTGNLEVRMVPGGYANLSGGGMNLGLITGLNADEDPSTRTPDLDSEPAYCVPPIPAPNFAAPPASLNTTSRRTFTLAAAGAFTGSPEPSSDLAIGISETTLDLAGHHLVTSGALCLAIGTESIAQLNLGTLQLLVPSLAALGTDSGKDPVLLMTRPQQAVDLSIGDGTVASPSIGLHLEHFEVDFYGYIYERYVRAFTIVLDVDAGINLEFNQPAGQPATITPVIVGLTSSNIHVQVINSEFVAESPASLEAVLPSVLDLVLPQLTGAIGAINVPSFAGFQLGNLAVSHVVTSQDDFLGITASMSASSALRAAARGNPMLGGAIADMDRTRTVSLGGEPTQSHARAAIDVVHTPSPAQVRAALQGVMLAGAGLPTVTFDVDHTDGLGHPLEWSWRIEGGMWHQFAADYDTSGRLAISEPAFAWQGKYTISLRSRVAGTIDTASDVLDFPVIIDSVSPTVDTDKVAWQDGQLAVPGDDLVSGSALRWAFGSPGDESPRTGWQTGGVAMLDRHTVDAIAIDGELVAFVQDEAGNTAQVIFKSDFHGQAASSGCGCASTDGGAGAGGLLMILLTAGVVLTRRRVRASRTMGRVRSAGVWLAASLCTAFLPACDCGGAQATSCETAEDCAGTCDHGQIAFCIDHTCVCADEVPTGRVGPYSDIGNSVAATWVSAYAQSHGDLVVAQITEGGRVADTAWEWVDGVPDGPVVVPGGTIRGGIADDGDDVGAFTSIVVTPAGEPMVSYFDATTGSLKFAQKVAGVWQKHIIDQGTGTVAGGGSIVGMYTSLTLRSDTGLPGVAYLAQVGDGADVRAEVRYAFATTATPVSAADWTIAVLDAATEPALDSVSPDPYPIPNSLGVFIDSTLGPDNNPVVTYYDRPNGTLKLATFDAASGAFDAATVIAGGGGLDEGEYPTVGVASDGTVNLAYTSTSAIDLKFRAVGVGGEETIDDGYRIVGQTADGLPKPEFHFVGADATMVMPIGQGPTVIYQDGTTHELLAAQRKPDGTWARRVIAGAEDPFAGGYGFFASATTTNDGLAISSWVIDQPTDDQWVQVFLESSAIE